MNHITPVKVEEDQELYEAVIKGLRERMGVDRLRPGDHVSDLLYCLLKVRTLRDLGRDRLEILGETPDEQVLTWMVGNSHQELFGSRLIKGKGKQLDGIWYTPDVWQATDEGELKMIEVKSTRMSSKWELNHSQHYIDQLASYLAAEMLTSGIVASLHLMGDYSRPLGAKLRTRKATFSKYDLQAWWQELRKRLDILHDERVPPAKPQYVWECEVCPVKAYLKCPGGKVAA